MSTALVKLRLSLLECATGHQQLAGSQLREETLAMHQALDCIAIEGNNISLPRRGHWLQ